MGNVKNTKIQLKIGDKVVSPRKDSWSGLYNEDGSLFQFTVKSTSRNFTALNEFHFKIHNKFLKKV